MTPRFEVILEKKLVGKHLRMSLANDKTFQLWQSFMSERRLILNNINSNLFSMQVYHNSLEPQTYNPKTQFEKWALAEVSDHDNIPANMERFTLIGGLYAVFIHKGDATTGAKTFQFIFKNWLPNSDYLLDTRPHFEVLGDKYKNNHPNSEEEIWIPIKKIN